MSDLNEYIATLKQLATDIRPDVVTRADGQRLKAQVNEIQTACQHIFTEIKAHNRRIAD